MKENKQLNILLVDDDSIDRELFMDAIAKVSTACSVSEAEGGNEALEFLKVAPHPNLIILDLNMPLKDGRETLREIKSSRHFRHIPVVILSTSNSHIDVLEAYESGACLFMEKPHDFDQLTEMLSCLLCLVTKYVSFSNPT